MSSDPLGPTESVQRAANQIARVRGEGGNLATIEADYPHLFAPLTRAENREARRLGRIANILTDAVRNANADRPISEYAPGSVPDTLEGVFQVRFRWDEVSSTGEGVSSYRTYLVAAAPYETRSSIFAAAMGSHLRDTPEFGGNPSSQEVTYLPFDTHRD